MDLRLVTKLEAILVMILILIIIVDMKVGLIVPPFFDQFACLKVCL